MNDDIDSLKNEVSKYKKELLSISSERDEAQSLMDKEKEEKDKLSHQVTNK